MDRRQRQMCIRDSHRPADSLVSPRQKQGVPIRPGDGPAHRQIIRQRILTRLVQIHDPHLITLTQDPQCVVVDIRQVQPDQLRNTQPAVKKQCQNAQIPLPVWSIHRLQQGNALIQGQICLLYTSDAADDLLCVDLGGRHIIKKKKKY